MDFESIDSKSSELSEPQWVGDIAGMGDLRLLVVPLSAPPVSRANSALMRRVPLAERGEDGMPTLAAEENTERELFLKHVLKGWENLRVNGEAVPYSAEKAERFLANDLFLVAVRQAAIRASAEIEIKYKVLEKNSQTSSSGGKTKAARTQKPSKSSDAGR